MVTNKTHSMGRLTIAIAVTAFAAIALAGCGGGSSTPDSPFAGNYAGTFTTSDAQSGTLNGAIGTDGKLTGTGHNDTAGLGEVITGSITNAGAVTITFNYTSTSATATGTFAFANNGHLTGTLTQSGGATVTADLVKQ